MSKQFKSLKAFATHLNKVAENYDKREKALLNIIGKFIEKESKSYIGHLQHIWPELADSTKEEKERLGYGDAANDWQPLLRTGELRDSIHYAVELHSIYIGSSSDIMIYHELGTARIPPRPVLGLAMYRNKGKIQKSIKDMMYSWIIDIRARGKVI